MAAASPSWRPLEGAAHQIAVEVLIHGPISRSEIARRLSMSPATLTRVTKPLLDAGLLFEATKEEGGARLGRPSQPLDVDPASRHFVGVKITSDAAHGVLTDLRANVQSQAVRPIADRAPDSVVATIAALTAELAAQVDRVTALGVSAGGVTEDNASLKWAAYMGWPDAVPLGPLLQERTGLPTVVENDVAAWTEAERWFGDGRDEPSFALVTTGMGVGFSLVTHGGRAASRDIGVGSLGHVPLDPLGPPCAQGHHGCAEAMLTSGAIEATVGIGLGRSVAYEEVLALAAEGQPVAVSTVAASARALGRLLALIANTTFVPLIIVSGEGIGLAVQQEALVRAEFAAGRHPMARDVRLLLKQAPFTEWARGAAVVAVQTYVLGR
ncbi:MAG: ROK family transcriptional regulator [Propionibacteriaceae bacterium]|nr:ROK family transcriptional regulator [Propionibacteriaceae bacterium]